MAKGTDKKPPRKRAGRKPSPRKRPPSEPDERPEPGGDASSSAAGEKPRVDTLREHQERLARHRNGDLLAAIEALGLSPAQVAQKTGIAASTIRSWLGENPKSSPPLEQVVAIAKAVHPHGDYLDLLAVGREHMAQIRRAALAADRRAAVRAAEELLAVAALDDEARRTVIRSLFGQMDLQARLAILAELTKQVSELGGKDSEE